MDLNLDVNNPSKSKQLRVISVSVAVLLLMLPLVAMQFTDEVVWDVADFAVVTALLASGCITFELVLRKSSSVTYLSAAGISLVASFLLIWVNGAVGIIGTENNPANFMYLGVLVIGCAGAISVRLQPAGMANTLFIMALVQVLIALLAVVSGYGDSGPAWPWDVTVATVFFTVLWLVSGWLFQRAAKTTL